LICPKFIATIRQTQKIDANDALAIIQASLLPEVRFASGKKIKQLQQQLQSIMRLPELAIKHKIALNNQLGSLLLEFTN
jgi:transposase